MATKKTGITLAAEGEKEFRKAISAINSDMKVMTSELRKVSAEYADNANSIEALTAKDKVLNELYDKQKQKVEECKKALENAKEQYAGNTEKINKWQESLNKAETDLAKTKNSIKQNSEAMEQAKSSENGMADGLDDVAKSADNANDKTLKMSDVLKANLLGDAIKSGLSALKNGFSDLLSVMGEMEEGYDTIATKTGASGKALQEMNDTAKEIYTEMPIEMADAGEAIGEVNTRFKQTGDELKNTSEEFIKFSKINGTDLSASVDTTDKILKQFNLDTSESSNVLGALTKAGQDTGESVSTLMDEVQSNGATFKEMGLNVDQSIQLLSQFSANGVNTDAALAGLKKSVKNFTDEGMSADEALGQIIGSIKNASSETDALNIAYETFGSKGGAEMSKAIREGRIDLDALSGSTGDYSNIVNDTYQNTQHAGDEIKTAINSLKVTAAEFGDMLVETFGDEFKAGIKSIKDFMTFVKNNKTAVVTTITAVGTGLLTWKVAGMVNALVTSIQAFKAANEGATVAQAILNGVMEANPIILIVSLIATLVAAIITLYMTNEDFRKAVNNIFGDIKDGAIAVKDFFVDLFEAGKNRVIETKDAIVDIGEFIGEKIGDIADTIIDGIGTAVDWIAELPGKAIEWAGDFIDGFVEGIEDGIDYVSDAVEDVADSIASFLHFSVPDEGPLADADTYGGDFMDLYSQSISDNMYKVRNAAAGVANGIKSNISPEITQNVNTNNNGLMASFENALSNLQLTATVNIGEKNVANVITPLVVTKMTKLNNNKLMAKGVL